MTEWSIFLVLGEIIALFAVVGKPLINLNTAITKLMTSVDSLNDRLKNQEKDFTAFATKASETHKEFHEHFDRHDVTLENHEQRIRVLEHK